MKELDLESLGGGRITSMYAGNTRDGDGRKVLDFFINKYFVHPLLCLTTPSTTNLHSLISSIDLVVSPSSLSSFGIFENANTLQINVTEREEKVRILRSSKKA